MPLALLLAALIAVSGSFAAVEPTAAAPRLDEADDLAAARAQPGVSEFYVGPEVQEQLEFAIARSGRYVRIQRAGTGYLSLAEVQLFGIPPGAGTPGLVHYEYYEGSFTSVPDFSTLAPMRSGSVPVTPLTSTV